jgi:hypothetical protein
VPSRKTRPEKGKAEPKRYQGLCEPAQCKTSREHNPTVVFAKLPKEVKEISSQPFIEENSPFVSSKA